VRATHPPSRYLRCVPTDHSPSSHAASYATQPLAPSPPPQIAGPSHLRGYQIPGDTTFHSTPTGMGQDNLLSSPSWYAVSTPVGSPHRNHSPGSRPPSSGRIGSLHSPATRHQPYPQSRPQQQGPHVDHSPVRSKAKGKNREILSVAMSHDLQTPNTPLYGNYLEVCPSAPRYCASSNTVCKPTTPITRPHNGTFSRSPQRPGTDPRCSQSHQAVDETLIPTQWSPAPRYPIGSMALGNVYRPATAHEHMSPINSVRESGGPMPASHTRPTQPQHQQLQVIATGSCSPAMHLSTPSMATNLLPDGSSRHPLPVQSKRSPWRVNQKRRPELLAPPAPGTPSPRYAVQQLVPHPHPRPVNVRQQVF